MTGDELRTRLLATPGAREAYSGKDQRAEQPYLATFRSSVDLLAAACDAGPNLDDFWRVLSELLANQHRTINQLHMHHQQALHALETPPTARAPVADELKQTEQA